MERPLTAVIILAVLSGALTFLGTLLAAPEEPNPRYPSMVRTAMWDGNWDVVADLSRRAMRATPGNQEAVMFLAFAEEREGDAGHARDLWQRLERMARQNIDSGNMDPSQLHYLGWALHGQGRMEEARAIWGTLVRTMDETTDFYNRACFLALAGDSEAALDAWERAVPALSWETRRWSRVDPDLASIRGDPRFEAARRRVREMQRSSPGVMEPTL